MVDFSNFIVRYRVKYFFHTAITEVIFGFHCTYNWGGVVVPTYRDTRTKFFRTTFRGAKINISVRAVPNSSTKFLQRGTVLIDSAAWKSHCPQYTEVQTFTIFYLFPLSYSCSRDNFNVKCNLILKL